MTSVPLINLAWGRSGDKGDKANIGIISRDEKYYPYILAGLTTEIVEQRFAHFIDKQKPLPSDAKAKVEAFLLPGIWAVNFLIHDVLGGGGVASVRNDAQGKGFAQILLATPISVPDELLDDSTQRRIAS
jgi:hypothetical protein